jgi:hypothetical protein
MRRFNRSLVYLVLVGATMACARSTSASSSQAPATAQPRTTLTVNNQNFLDFTIYLISGAQRIRLGDARGNSSTKLVIPSQYLFGLTSVQFLADPIGGRRTPISQTINITPGDAVELVIPPNA